MARCYTFSWPNATFLGCKTQQDAFNRVFKLLGNILGEDTFKKYYSEQSKFRGSVTLSAFEAMVPVISKRIDDFEKVDTQKLTNRIKEMHGFDRNGKAITITGIDFLAATLYHEINHLDGILFTDKLSPEKPT